MADVIRKRRRSALGFSKDPFDAIQIFSATYLKSGARSLKWNLEVLPAIDEKYGGVDLRFLSKFAEEDFGEGSRGRRKESDVQQFVRGWISSGVQPDC